MQVGLLYPVERRHPTSHSISRSFPECILIPQVVRFKYVVYKTAQLSKYMDNFESHLNKLINFNFRAIIWIIFVDIYLIKLYNFCNLIE